METEQAVQKPRVPKGVSQKGGNGQSPLAERTSSTVRKEFTAVADGDGNINVAIDILDGIGTATIGSLAMQFTSPCNGDSHSTLLTMAEWSVFKQLEECELSEESVGASFVRPVSLSVVSSGFSAGQQVSGFAEIVETSFHGGSYAQLLDGIDSPIENLFEDAYSAIGDLYAEAHRLTHFAKLEWLNRGDGNTVVDTSLPLTNSDSGEGAELAAATVTLIKKLGTHRLPDQTRMHKHSTYDYRFEKRRVDIPVYVEFTGPGISAFWNDIVRCTNYAVSAAIIVAVALENPAAGYNAFYPTWKGCMLARIGDRVRQIQVALRTGSKEYGSWTNH